LLVPGIFFFLSDHLTELSVVQFLISAGIELCEGELHLVKQQSIFTTSLSLFLCQQSVPALGQHRTKAHDDMRI